MPQLHLSLSQMVLAVAAILLMVTVPALAQPAPPPPAPAPYLPPLDTDGDNIADTKDACPTIPEDLDGFKDDDGCPDPDNDNDGILDRVDQCPNEPEDFDGDLDEDGCVDAECDAGQIREGKHCCWPGQNWSSLKNGCMGVPQCPEPWVLVDKTCILDTDKDGVPDALDRCPEEAGKTELAGCPKDNAWAKTTAQEMSRCSSAMEKEDYSRLVAEGVELSVAGTLDEALTRFEEAQFKCTADPVVTYALARLHHIYGDCPNADQLYKTALMQHDDATAFKTFEPGITRDRIEAHMEESRTSCQDKN